MKPYKILYEKYVLRIKCSQKLVGSWKIAIQSQNYRVEVRYLFFSSIHTVSTFHFVWSTCEFFLLQNIFTFYEEERILQQIFAIKKFFCIKNVRNKICIYLISLDFYDEMRFDAFMLAEFIKLGKNYFRFVQNKSLKN